MKVIQNYTLTLNFVKKTIIDILKTYWSTKPHKPWWQKKNSKNNLHILEDNTSGVQVGDIEQVVVKNLFKVW